jgi:hypothetical protein
MTHPTQATKKRPLRLALRLAALVTLAGSIGFWAAKGAHTGWTMNQVPRKQTDEITGIEFVTYEKRYVPGLDFIGLALGAAAGLFAISFLVQRKTSNSTQ